MVLFEITMKRVIVIVLLLGCIGHIASQQVYTNNLYCTSTLTLSYNGRADWFDCEIDETFYGHYWQCNDTLFVETFCSSKSHEDHRCFSLRLDINIIKTDTLLNIGYKEAVGNSSFYSDSINYYLTPHAYILKK